MATADSTPSTTERVVRILSEFGSSGAPLGVSEVARRCGLSKAVVHRILQTLVHTGFLRFLPDVRRYAIGPAALSLGHEAVLANAVRAAALPVISHLAAATGETTTVTERVGHMRHYVGQIESSKPIRITIRLGEQVPLWSGASGLSILAFMDETDIDYVLDGELTSYTSTTVTDPDRIRKRLAQIRDRGWAETAGERVPYSSSIAAPIFGLEPAAVGSLSVAILADRMDGHPHDQLAAAVVDAAAEASARLRRAMRGQDEERTHGVRPVG